MRLVGAAALGLVAASPAGAQSPGEIEPTREAQAELYAQLLDDPDNAALMIAYARTSVALRDFESAIATLERLLIFEPDLTGVKVELGAAYFALGSYTIAEFYFDAALAAGDLTAAEVEKVGRFKEEIVDRTATSSFSGQASLGIVAATNANLGVANDVIRAGTADVALPDDLEPASDFGVRAVASLSHVYDLNQVDGDTWRTDAFAYALQFFNEDEGNLNVLALRTGPTVSLNDDSFGPKIRPIAEVEYVRADDAELYVGIGGGAEYQNTLTEEWSVFSTVLARARFFSDGRSDFDGAYSFASVGAAWTPQRSFRLRSDVRGEWVETDEDFNDYLRVALRGAALYSYDSGIDWVERDWLASGFLEVSRRFGSEPDPDIDADESRRDVEFRGGINNTFFLQDDFFARAELDFIVRRSSVENFDLNGVTGTLSLGKSF